MLVARGPALSHGKEPRRCKKRVESLEGGEGVRVGGGVEGHLYNTVASGRWRRDGLVPTRYARLVFRRSVNLERH